MLFVVWVVIKGVNGHDNCPSVRSGTISDNQIECLSGPKHSNNFNKNLFGPKHSARSKVRKNCSN